jgi:hypothetical protein
MVGRPFFFKSLTTKSFVLKVTISLKPQILLTVGGPSVPDGPPFLFVNG